MLTIFAVSDGTGETAQRMADAAMTQFQNTMFEVVQRGDVLNEEQVRAVVQEAVTSGDAVILHTLVSHQLRHIILEECRLRGVDVFDLMGPVLDRLAGHLHLTPQEKPGLLEEMEMHDPLTRQIEAVEFAFQHDDGQNADDLSRAEVVLVGISRSKKTPLMLYMAYRGWFAANVPLIPEIPLPDSVLRVPSRRVFCLFTDPARLLELRRVRARQQNIPEEIYASTEQIRKEMLYAEHACAQHGWQRLDVTGKSVEELCQEIITLLGPSIRRYY